jgi:hypothetical protein
MKQVSLIVICFMLLFSFPNNLYSRTPFDFAQGDIVCILQGEAVSVMPSEGISVIPSEGISVMPSGVEACSKPGPLNEHRFRIFSDHKRFIAACLALPLPVGFLGAHRIFLGTNPYIPVAYVATLGGCLGIIPTIDFFVIVFTRDLDKYTDNPRMFMWMK